MSVSSWVSLRATVIPPPAATVLHLSFPLLPPDSLLDAHDQEVESWTNLAADQVSRKWEAEITKPWNLHLGSS